LSRRRQGAHAREHLSFCVDQDNYRRILMAQGFAAADLENGDGDRLVDAVGRMGQ